MEKYEKIDTITMYYVHYFDPVLNHNVKSSFILKEDDIDTYIDILISNGCTNFSISKLVETQYKLKK